jgi:hypothetical protein
LIAIAIATINGNERAKAAAATTTSIVRLKQRADRLNVGGFSASSVTPSTSSISTDRPSTSTT